MKNDIISPRMKQIQIRANGKVYCFEAFSWDGGHSWCSDPKATVAFLKRRKAALDTRLTPTELRRIDRLDGDVDDVGIEAPGDFEKKRRYMRVYSRGYRAARRERKPREPKTHCIRGHELTAENVRVYGQSRYCKECQKIRMAAYTDRKKRLQSDFNKRGHRHVA